MSDYFWSDDEIETLKELYPEYTNSEIANRIDRSKRAVSHKGRRLGLEKDEGLIFQNKLNSVSVPDTESEFAVFVSGLVAGEGCFTSRGDSRHEFLIGMSDRDKELLESVENFFNVGYTHPYETDNENWDDQFSYHVSANHELAGVIIPFFDGVGIGPSYKQKQYNEWRRSFIESLDDEQTERLKCL